MYEQIGKCHQSFRYDFAVNCSAVIWVSWKIIKGIALNHRKQEKVTNKVVQENLWRDKYHAHSTSAFKTQSNNKWLFIFGKNCILGSDYMVGNFSLGWNFNSLNRDEISSHMLSDKNLKRKLRLYTKISSRSWKTELKLPHGLNEPSWDFHFM